jgi:hypothetical protein
MFCPKCGTESLNDAQFCRECGSTLGSRVQRAGQQLRTAPSRPAQSDKPPRVGLKLLFVVVVVIGVLWVLFVAEGTPRTQPSSAEPPEVHPVTLLSTTPSAPTVPPQEAAFASMVKSFVPSYNQADTEIRKTNVRFERKQAMAKFFSGSDGLRFQNWVGIVKSVTTESDGEAALSLTLLGDSDLTIATWNNSFSDSSAHTMIARSDSLYGSLMNIKSGDVVRVSGTFLSSGSAADEIKESSLTEEGAMTSPDFIVRFTEIHRADETYATDTDPEVRPSAGTILPSGPVSETEINNSAAGRNNDATVQKSVEDNAVVQSSDTLPETSSAIAESAPELQFGRGARVMIHLTDLERKANGGFDFSGTLFPPLPDTGAVQLDQTVQVVGFGNINKNGRLLVSVTRFVVGGKAYQAKMTGNNTGAAWSGPGVELVAGRTLEMWFDNTSIYAQ